MLLSNDTYNHWTTKIFCLSLTFFFFLLGSGRVDLKPLLIPLSIGGSLEKTIIIPALLSIFVLFSSKQKIFTKQLKKPLLLHLIFFIWIIISSHFHLVSISGDKFMVYFLVGILTALLTMLSFNLNINVNHLLLSLVLGLSISILKGEYQMFFTPIRQFGLDNGSTKRLFTNIGHPNFLGAFLVLIIPMSISLWLTTAKKSINKIIFSLLLLILCSGLVLSYSRSAWVAFLFSISILLIHKFAKNKKKLAIFFLLIINILIFIGGQINHSNSNNPFLKRILSFTNIKNDNNLLERTYAWKSSFIIAKDHLLTGIGAGNERFEHYYKQHKLPQAKLLMPHPHNIFLHILTSFGLIGFFLFIIIIIKGIRYSYRLYKTTNDYNFRNFKLMNIISLSSFLLYSCFDSPMFAERVSPMLWITISFLYYNPKQINKS